MFKCISIEKAAELINSSTVSIVDIRDPQSFAAGHLPNAKNINNQNLAEYIDEADKSLPLIVVCYHGHSSQPAANLFASQGFEDVYSMDGGFEMWKITQLVER